MAKAPAFQWYAKEWLTDDKRIEMSLAQRGVYADLMSYQWINGSVPANAEQITRVIGEDAEPHWNGHLLAAFPLREDGRRMNLTLEDYRTWLKEQSEKRSAAGKKGALSRWGGEANAVANGNRTAEPMAKNGSASATASATALKEDTTRETDSRVTEVLQHYKDTHPRRHVFLPSGAPLPTMARLVGSRLKDGASAEDLKHAITGNARDPWHRDKRKHELAYVFRNADKVNEFLDKYHDQESPATDGLGNLI